MVAPTLAALVAITVAGSGGERIARERLRSCRLLGAAAVVRLSVGLPPLSADSASAARVAVIAADALLTAFCLANWAARTCVFRMGLGLVLAGAALNAIPTVWAGAMPFSPSAAADARVSAAEIADPAVGHVALAGQPGAVAALSDVVPLPWLRSVASVGDIALLTGGAALAGALLPRRRTTRRP